MWLQYDQQKYSTEQLPALNSYSPTSNFYKAIQFYLQWKSGQQEFEISTSGSTGTPKKIILTKDQLQSSAHKTINALSLQKNYTALIPLDVGYIAGMMMMVRCLEADMNVIITEPSSNPFEKIDSTTHVDFTALVPLQVQTILVSKQQTRFNELKSVLIGGAVLDQKTKKILRTCNTQFYETYGMTETVSHIALRQINGSYASEYFNTLPGVIISKDERGCLVIHVDFLNDQSIVTNDIVDIITPNSFKWLGRIDFVINTGGIKVYPERIEAKIEEVFEQEGVQNRFFVAGMPDERLGNAVTLIIEALAVSDEKSLRLHQQFKTVLTKYEVPKSILFINDFSVTETGKINRLKTIERLPQGQVRNTFAQPLPINREEAKGKANR